MYKIAAIGDKDSVGGLAALGMHVFPVEDGQAAKELLRKLAEGGYAIIYITEKFASQIPAEMDWFSEAFSPAVIPIPGVSGNTGMGLERISSMVEKAVGVDIFK
jgi:V/A-type H+-transporting ATPase subunit F